MSVQRELGRAGRTGPPEDRTNMRKSRFTESQNIGIPKEAKAGAKVADLARVHGVSSATIYSWRSKYGGLGVNEAKRLRELEAGSERRIGR